MRFEQWNNQYSVVTWVQLLLLCIAIGVPLAQWQFDSSKQWALELQRLKVHRLQLVRALGILKENTNVSLSLKNRNDTVESITLAILEAIKRQAVIDEVELTQLTVTAENREQSQAELKALRIKFSVVMLRAISLLNFFDAIKNAADWRPIEIRGCEVFRADSPQVELNAACIVDVYYFPSLIPQG